MKAGLVPEKHTGSFLSTWKYNGGSILKYKYNGWLFSQKVQKVTKSSKDFAVEPYRQLMSTVEGTNLHSLSKNLSELKSLQDHDTKY